MEGLFNDNISNNDFLGYGIYVESFKYIIDSDNKIIQPPVVFGIHGKWGSGKSTFMELLKNKLTNDRNIIININPWEYEEATDFVTVFFALLYKKVISGKFSEGFKRGLTKFVYPLLRTIKVSVKTPAYMPISGDVAVDFSKLSDSEQDKILNDFIKNKYLRRDSIRDILNEVELNGNKIIVFIDDLDRCSVDKVINIIESIKLFLNSDNCIFFLGCDLEYLKSAIAIHYKDYIEYNLKKKSNSDHEGEIKLFTKEYLEKIIQIPFNLPAIDKENIKVFMKQILKIDTKGGSVIYLPNLDDSEFVVNMEFMSNVFFENNASPRKVKRIISLIYLNYIILKYKRLKYISIDFISLLTVIYEFNVEYYKENFLTKGQAVTILSKMQDGSLDEMENGKENKNAIIKYFVDNLEIRNKIDFGKIKEEIQEYIFVTEISQDDDIINLKSDIENGLSFKEFFGSIEHDENLNQFFSWFFSEWYNKEYFKINMKTNYLELYTVNNEFIVRINVNKNTSTIEIKDKSSRKSSIFDNIQKIESTKGTDNQKLKEELKIIKEKVSQMEGI